MVLKPMVLPVVEHDFYDDNSIVGIELVEAFNLLNNQDYLTKAKRIVEFLQAGEDDMFGGGPLVE